MPYPSKTDRQTILSAALKQLAHVGIRDLSLRNLAASLDLAPNAIYRYFSDRSALEAALASEAARQMESALRRRWRMGKSRLPQSAKCHLPT